MTDKTAALQKASTYSRAPSGLLLRKCACGSHTTAGGECNSCRATRERAGLQAKLVVNEHGDAYEEEADRLAAAVMSNEPMTRLGGP